ncbi:uncharacterized protein VTP21DRAFT_2539 [Calcarisporiella thermophila]|uniref:uncharacterized protein n=1 Tax=Calcarisporiella thermophila TaxID=911321 RepID=UPI0037431798
MSYARDSHGVDQLKRMEDGARGGFDISSGLRVQDWKERSSCPQDMHVGHLGKLNAQKGNRLPCLLAFFPLGFAYTSLLRAHVHNNRASPIPRIIRCGDWLGDTLYGGVSERVSAGRPTRNKARRMAAC